MVLSGTYLVYCKNRQMRCNFFLDYASSKHVQASGCREPNDKCAIATIRPGG